MMAKLEDDPERRVAKCEVEDFGSVIAQDH